MDHDLLVLVKSRFVSLRGMLLADKLEKSAIVFSQDHFKVFCCSCQAIKPFFLCTFLNAAGLSAQASCLQKVLFHRENYILNKQVSIFCIKIMKQTKKEGGFTCVVHIK